MAAIKDKKKTILKNNDKNKRWATALPHLLKSTFNCEWQAISLYIP